MESPSGSRHERWKPLGGVSEGRGGGTKNRCIGTRDMVYHGDGGGSHVHAHKGERG